MRARVSALLLLHSSPFLQDIWSVAKLSTRQPLVPLFRIILEAGQVLDDASAIAPSACTFTKNPLDLELGLVSKVRAQ